MRRLCRWWPAATTCWTGSARSWEWTEATGHLVHGTQARELDMTYEGEASAGDGLRREWFGLAMAEMLDPDRGLFMSHRPPR